MRQAVVILRPTNETIPDRYEDELTIHRYGVVKLWEQDPAPLLEHEGLLPLATLCRAESGEKLLGHVAARINHIKDRKRRSETLNWSRMMAGLRYDKGLITGILKESDMLEESVIYQDIFRKGKRQGVRQGAEQEARKVATRQLERRFGKPSRTAQRQIELLTVERLEALCDALLDFKSKDDLTRWLKQDG